MVNYSSKKLVTLSHNTSVIDRQTTTTTDDYRIIKSAKNGEKILSRALSLFRGFEVVTVNALYYLLTYLLTY